MVLIRTVINKYDRRPTREKEIQARKEAWPERDAKKEKPEWSPWVAAIFCLVTHRAGANGSGTETAAGSWVQQDIPFRVGWSGWAQLRARQDRAKVLRRLQNNTTLVQRRRFLRYLTLLRIDETKGWGKHWATVLFNYCMMLWVVHNGFGRPSVNVWNRTRSI